MLLRAWLAQPRVRWAVGLAAAVAAIGLLVFLRAALAPFALAGALTFLLSPLVEWGCRRGLRRVWSVLLVYTFLGVLVAALVAFALPVLVGEVQRLADGLPRYTQQVESLFQGLQARYAHSGLPPALREAVDASLQHGEGRLDTLLRSWIGGLVGLLKDLVLLVLAPVLAFYMLVDLPRLRRAGLRWLPPEARQSLLRYFDELDDVLSGYVRGQLALAVVVGALSAVALWVLGVPYAVLLGLFAGMGELVPYFGPILGAIPAVGVALLQSPRLALYVIVAFLAIQQVESAVVGPFIMRSTLGLHPLVVIFALLAGAEAAGFAGVVLAIPFVGFLVVSGRFLLRFLVR